MIFENESRVWEEEGVEEAAGNIHVNNVDAHNRVQVKDINFDYFFNALYEGDSTSAINFLKNYKLSDLFFIRGSQTEYIDIHQVIEDAHSIMFNLVSMNKSLLNIVQLAAGNGKSMFLLVKYLLKEH